MMMVIVDDFRFDGSRSRIRYSSGLYLLYVLF